MISANGGLPAHRYTPQVTPRWPRGSEPASAGGVSHDLPDLLLQVLGLAALQEQIALHSPTSVGLAGQS